VSEVLYRKYRPQTFAEVVGQEGVTRTLRNSVASGRLAHAYLFCGPRGTGKTSLGRLLAKAANCASTLEGEPCNRCDSCLAFIEGRAMDFVEQDAASHNSVDDIRQLRENVILTPMSGGRKVYLLDEVHMLSKGAENALLKTLEEPPPHIIFVLATTEPHKVESTIISRCQRFDLRRIPLTAIVERLSAICEREGFTLDAASLEDIARSATGSLRDAINALEQVVTYYGPSPGREQVQEALGVSVDLRSGELSRLVLSGDLAGALKLVAAVRDDGVDMKQFTRQVVRYLRGMLLAKAGVDDALDLPAELAAEIKAASRGTERAEIVRALRTFARTEFRGDSQSSLPVELAVIELVSAESTGRREGAPPAVAEKAAPGRPEPGASRASAVSGVESTETASRTRAPAPTLAGYSEILEHVRQASKDTDKQLSALLNGSCEVKSVEGDTVVLGFYHTFHLERIEKGPYAARLNELFSNALGRKVIVVYEHAPRERQQPAVRGGHLAEAARQLGAIPVGGSGVSGQEGGPNG
jgi:DNA polymerase-3 subunit gamma/tau